MSVRASAVGASFGERIVGVTPRQMLAYAAGIGETGRWAHDDADTESFVATPQFCVSLEWPTVSDPGMRESLGLDAEESRNILHMGQDSTFHRPIRPGDRLRIVGTLAEIRATRAGALTLSRIETTDVESGEPVVTTWTTGLVRGAAVEGTAAPIGEKPALPPGERLERAITVEIPIAREMPQIYTECADIWNPIHTERAVALSAGLPDIILHGTATWAIAGRELIHRCAGNEPRRLHRLAGRFAAMVIPGTSITLEYARAREGTGHIFFRICNSDGEAALSDGVATILPAP